MHLDCDPALLSVVGFVREIHTPIYEVISTGKPVGQCDVAALSGALSALLDAVDARLTPEPQQQSAKEAA